MSEVITPPVPPVTEAPAVETPKPEMISPKFEMLAKRESALVRQQQEAKREREELQKMRDDMKSEREEFDKYKERKKLAKLNPNVALEDYGLTYEQLTDYQLRGGTPPGEVIAKSVQEQLAQFRKEHEESLKKDRDAQELKAKELAEQQVADFKVNLTEYITEKGDEFELINKYEQYELVYQTIAQHFEETKAKGSPKVLTAKEAADLVEKHLEDLVEQGTKTKKFANRLKPSEATAEALSAKEQVSKTLNNSMNSSSVPSSLPKQTEDERIKRALAALG